MFEHSRWLDLNQVYDAKMKKTNLKRSKIKKYEYILSEKEKVSDERF